MCDIWIQWISSQAEITLRDLANQLSQIPKEHSIFQDMIMTQSMQLKPEGQTVGRAKRQMVKCLTKGFAIFKVLQSIMLLSRN